MKRRPNHPHASLISGLGGPSEVSRLLRKFGIVRRPQSISQWKKRGIAWRHRPLMVRIAAAQRKSALVPRGFVDERS